MSVTIPNSVIAKTTIAKLETDRVRRYGEEVSINVDNFTAAEFDDLIRAAEEAGVVRTARAMESIKRALEGKFEKPVPSFSAFEEVFKAYLRANVIDGWLYVQKSDGRLYPELVVSIKLEHNRSRNENPTIALKTTYYGHAGRAEDELQMRVRSAHYSFEATDIAKKRIADILANRGLFAETPELKSAHAETIARYESVIRPAFSEQFRVNGRVLDTGNYFRTSPDLGTDRKVLHDLEERNFGPMENSCESVVFDKSDDHSGLGAIPVHPVVRIFDLKTHDFYWTHSDTLTPYVYNKKIGEKLILPATHRDLLDVLTTDLDAFTADFVEGKSAGNVILNKGLPGLGKTLTAEVYAELIGRPLYSIRSGTLGTKADDIEKNLRNVFQRAKRWNAVLLLDEADVFVVKRGGSIEQNSVVAEFLRTLEYFDGLMFMTTNRPDDIDDAIISRCAAIIYYTYPSKSDAAAIWRVMSDTFEANISDNLIGELITLFPTISARDIKMLLRLALRVSIKQKKDLTIDTFRRCAMFRAIEMNASGDPYIPGHIQTQIDAVLASAALSETQKQTVLQGLIGIVDAAMLPRS